MKLISGLTGTVATLVLVSCTGMVEKGSVINSQRFYDQGKYDKALTHLALSNPDDREATLLKAKIYEAKGDRDRAKSIYTELATQHPNSSEGVYSKTKLRSF